MKKKFSLVLDSHTAYQLEKEACYHEGNINEAFASIIKRHCRKGHLEMETRAIIQDLNELELSIATFTDKEGADDPENKLYKEFADAINVAHERLKLNLGLLELGEQPMPGNWKHILSEYPKVLQTVWITNGKGWTDLGCRIDTGEGLMWAKQNGNIYQEGNQIIAECEADDLDVVYWCEVPNAILPNV